MQRLKVGDEVKVISGNFKGARAVILRLEKSPRGVSRKLWYIVEFIDVKDKTPLLFASEEVEGI